MGTSSLPPPPSSLPLHSPLDDWFTPSNSDHFSADALPHDGLSSASGSSSSSSSSSDHPQRRSFLHSNDFDSPLHLRAHASFSQRRSPVLSSTSASPVSPLNTNSGCISAMTTYSMPNSNASEPLQAFHGGFNHLANSILKPLEENTSSCISSILTSASASASPVALSSAASTGAAVTKVSKRRARVNKKAPIAVLSADTSNFRAMVQQLTGIPPTHASPQIWRNSGAPLLRPQPTRFASYNGGLPTLDTSVPFLGPRQILPLLQRAQQPLMNGLLSSGASSNGAELSSSQCRGNMASYDTSSLTSISGLWDAPGSDVPSGLQTKGLSAESLVRECEQSFPRQGSSLLESLLTDEDFAKSSLYGVDSWLASDGGALNLSPRMDLTKIAS